MTGSSEIGAILTLLGSGKGELPAQLSIAQKLIEVLPVPVFFKGRDGVYLGVNKAWESFFGIPRGDIVGRPLDAIYPQAPSVAQRHRAMDEELWRHPGDQHYEITVPRSDGALRHTLYYKATFNADDGTVAGLIGTIIDITERKQAEQRQAIEFALTRVLAEAQGIADAVPMIIRSVCEALGWACGAHWEIDREAGVLRCADAWGEPTPEIEQFLAHSSQRMMPLGNEGLIRRAVATAAPAWIPDVTQEPGFLRANLAANAGLRAGFAMPIVSGLETVGVIEFFGREARHPLGWLIEVATDLGGRLGQFAARKQAEQALRESEARFRSLTELSSDWYWEQDAQYRFIMMSRGIDNSIGVQPGDFIGKKRWDAHTAGISAEQWAEHKAALDAREPFRDLVYGCFDAAGNVRYLSTSGHPVFDGEGNFRGYRGVGKDVTERIKAEQALREAHASLELKAQELARSNAELEQFAYVASHDLQEPLRMVASYTQLLLRRYGDRFDSDAREFMDYVVDGAARMKQLIEDLLAYSRVGTRGKEFRRVPCEAVLRKALANLKIAIDQSGASVTHDALPEVVVDDMQWMQLFQNLIGNAVKFRGEQPPAAHVSVEDRDGEWLFGIRDNGIGIEPQYYERIFMVFQRLGGRAEHPGTGIGLAICKKVVERHGGRIWVESQPGQGSAFFFTLPKREGETHA